MALGGEEALQVLRTQCTEASGSCPALVFLDINMPQMNGFEFLSAYQQLPLPQRGAIVIVMLTTSLHPQDLQRLRQFPVAGFLSKPLNQDKVNDVLHAHVRQPAQPLAQAFAPTGVSTKPSPRRNERAIQPARFASTRHLHPRPVLRPPGGSRSASPSALVHLFSVHNILSPRSVQEPPAPPGFP